MDSHSISFAVASSSDVGVGAEMVLQNSFPSQIPSQSREVLTGYDDSFDRGQAGGSSLLGKITSMAWLSRFGIVVAILMAFHVHGNMLVAWCRQWVMWMISILSPTPGSSGVVELMFRLYYSDFLPDASIAILAAMLWRLIFCFDVYCLIYSERSNGLLLCF